MKRTNLFLKVEIEHDKDDKPEILGAELCRLLMRTYGVRIAELSNFSTRDE